MNSPKGDIFVILHITTRSQNWRIIDNVGLSRMPTLFLKFASSKKIFYQLYCVQLIMSVL